MSRKSAGLLILAIVLLIFFGIFFAVLVNILTEPYSPHFDAGVFELSMIFFIPAVLVIWLWRRQVAHERQLRGAASAQEQRLRDVASILSMYNQIPLTELATRLGVTPQEAEALTSAVLAAGYAKGHVDRATGIFYPETGGAPAQREVVTRERVLIRCKFCGALVEQGQTRCTSCGAVLA